MTQRNRVLARIEELLGMDLDEWRVGTRVLQNVYRVATGEPVTQFHKAEDAATTCTLRNISGGLLELLRDGLECERCGSSGISWREPCRVCTPRIAKMAKILGISE